MNKVKKIVTGVIIMTMLLGSVCFASSPTLVTGTQKLLSDVEGWLIGLEVAITVVLAIWRGIIWQKAEEEEKPRARKALTGTIVAGIVVISLTALVPFIFSYYQ